MASGYSERRGDRQGMITDERNTVYEAEINLVENRLKKA
jgi:hypothetical protein